MVRLKIYIGTSHRSYDREVQETATPDGIINKLIEDGIIVNPPPPAPDGVTIWKMSKVGKGNRAIGDCIGTPGFVEGDTAFVFPVKA